MRLSFIFLFQADACPLVRNGTNEKTATEQIPGCTKCRTRSGHTTSACSHFCLIITQCRSICDILHYEMWSHYGVVQQVSDLAVKCCCKWCKLQDVLYLVRVHAENPRLPSEIGLQWEIPSILHTFLSQLYWSMLLFPSSSPFLHYHKHLLWYSLSFSQILVTR